MCQRIAADEQLRSVQGPGTTLPVHHTSVGDLLRKQVDAGALPPELVEKVEKQILMDGRDLTRIIASADIEGRLARGEIVILDGFPRNMDQLRAFGDEVSERCRPLWLAGLG